MRGIRSRSAGAGLAFEVCPTGTRMTEGGIVEAVQGGSGLWNAVSEGGRFARRKDWSSGAERRQSFRLG